jgi:hypothetical protein
LGEVFAAIVPHRLEQHGRTHRIHRPFSPFSTISPRQHLATSRAASGVVIFEAPDLAFGDGRADADQVFSVIGIPKRLTRDADQVIRPLPPPRRTSWLRLRSKFFDLFGIRHLSNLAGISHRGG